MPDLESGFFNGRFQFGDRAREGENSQWLFELSLLAAIAFLQSKNVCVADNNSIPTGPSMKNARLHVGRFSWYVHGDRFND